MLDLFLVALQAGRRPRLILTAPPQHGKSELVSRRFPAYALGEYPDLGIIATTYNAQRANQVSAEVQRIMQSERYRHLFPKTCIAGRHSTSQALRRADLFEIVDHRGFYRACGIGGGITGMRADIVIIDDPIKNDAGAQSPILRDKEWDWFASTAYTRLSNAGGVIIIMTRWHQDDLVGRILKLREGEGIDNWAVRSFPAIAEEDDQHRNVGEALSAERYPLESLLKIKNTIGSYKWAALYQQHPSPPEGGIIQRAWINVYSAVPDQFDEVVQSWDLTYKDHQGSDFVAGHVWGRIGADFYLLDRVHGRMDCPATIAAIRSMSSVWPQATRILVEDAANGPAVVAMLRNQLPGVIPVPPQGSKRSRMYAVAALFESGNVYVPDPTLAPWIGDVVEEWVSFPHAAHDDDCDAMSQALIRLKLHPDYGPPPFLIGGDDADPTVPRGASMFDQWQDFLKGL
jgi:predicted phage terminase large subunit-like protein